jgi:DNA anti-recombination protein RmuC
MRSKGSATDGSGPRQPGSNGAELAQRIEKLASLLAAFAQEAVAARRESARLRSQNTTLQRRIDELETRVRLTRDPRGGDG